MLFDNDEADHSRNADGTLAGERSQSQRVEELLRKRRKEQRSQSGRRRHLGLLLALLRRARRRWRRAKPQPTQ